jgi:cytoskeleton protein RodZ
MNVTIETDETLTADTSNPGGQLAAYRQLKGFTQEQVAGKLRLRTQIIELLEMDAYHRLPAPVFIKGYLQAYAKLLEIDPEPLLEKYNSLHLVDKQQALWQSRRESNKAESLVRWFTVLFGIGVMVAVGIWWQKNKEVETLSTKEPVQSSQVTPKSPEIRLTDLSKMQSLFSSEPGLTPVEKQVD